MKAQEELNKLSLEDIEQIFKGMEEELIIEESSLKKQQIENKEEGSSIFKVIQKSLSNETNKNTSNFDETDSNKTLMLSDSSFSCYDFNNI